MTPEPAWLRSWSSLIGPVGEDERAAAMAALLHRGADDLNWRGAGWRPRLWERPPLTVEIPPLPAAGRPELFGQAYESLLGSDQRRRGGSHFTPSVVAEGLCRLVLDAATTRPGESEVRSDPR